MQQKQHWEKVFETKADSEKSWFQPYPETSVQFIKDLNIPKDAAIIDVGGGDSYLADVLLQEGYKDITVLDISAKALQNARKRLGKKANRIKWVESDVLSFHPEKKYDCWHDRAVFHFVTDKKNITAYKKQIAGSVKDKGKLIVGTFSEKGPEKCSGLPVHRYSQQQLTRALSQNFKKIKCIEEIHQTPFNTSQSFTFCSFQKKAV
ncbi:MAG TPA: class I SAM-dependent methyltransferase [Chitinophagaceae bacterium]|nr:class I SAM-dependent methyltransferase [Chitinophagaceae bacterium]